jgi:hypothetical protein
LEVFKQPLPAMKALLEVGTPIDMIRGVFVWML